MSSLMTPENVAGLVVGEGCFYVESKADPKYKSGWRVRPAFCVEMRHDDREVLEGIRSHLDCGSIYDLDFGRYKGYESKKWKPHVKYRVGNLADMRDKVVPFFRRYPLFGRKRTAFELCAEIVELLHAKEHLTPKGLEKVRVLAGLLTEHNKRG